MHGNAAISLAFARIFARMVAASPLPFALVLRTAAMLGGRRALAHAGAGILFACTLPFARIESATDVRITEKRILESRGFIVGSGDCDGARSHTGQSGQGQFSKISSAQVQAIRHRHLRLILLGSHAIRLLFGSPF
jgi:hypothetical protein